MNSQLDKLFQLQGVDLRLLDKQREVDRFEKELAERRQKMAAVKGRIDALMATRKQIVTERALSERRLSEREELLRDRRQRMGRVRTEREHRAGQDEAESMSREVDEEETKLLEVMEKVEAMQSAVAIEQASYDDLASADHRQVEEVGQRIEALKKELAEERLARDLVAQELEPRMRKRYDLILSRRGGLAVVQVEDGCCAGCHMQIPAQSLIEVMKTGAIRVCQSCQRILYVRAPHEVQQAIGE